MRRLTLFALLLSIGAVSATAQETDSVFQLENEWLTPSGDIITLHISDGFYASGDKDEAAMSVLAGTILRVETIYNLEYYYESQSYGYTDDEAKDDSKTEDPDDFLLEVKYSDIPLEKGLQFRICSLSDSLLILHPLNLSAVKLSALMQRVYPESEMETVTADAKTYLRELNAAGKGKKRADVINKWKTSGFYADTLRLVNSFLSLEPIQLDSLVFAEFSSTKNEYGEGSIAYRDLVISGNGEYRYRGVFDIIPKDDPRNSSFKRDETKVVDEFPGEKSGNAETIQFLPPVIEEYETEPYIREPEERTLYKLRNQLYEQVGIPAGLDYFAEGNLDTYQHETMQYELDRVHLSTFQLPSYEESWSTWGNETTQKLILYYNNGMKRTFVIPDNMQPMALSGILLMCHEITDIRHGPSKKGYASSPYFPHSFATSPVR